MNTLASLERARCMSFRSGTKGELLFAMPLFHDTHTFCCSIMNIASFKSIRKKMMASKVLHRLEFIFVVLRVECGCSEGYRQRDCFWLMSERDRGADLAHVRVKWVAIVDDLYGLAIFQSILVRPIRSNFTKVQLSSSSALYHGHSNSMENDKNWMWLNWIKFHSWRSIRSDLDHSMVTTSWCN